MFSSTPIDELETMFLAKTETGQSVLKDRSVALTSRQRAAFILFDGKKSLDEVMAATAAMGVSIQDVEQLIELGLLGRVSAPSKQVSSPQNSQLAQPLQPAAPNSQRPEAQRYQDAYKIASQLTSGLGLRGFRLNLAVEGAQGLEELKALAPKILAAVGENAYLPLHKALND